jgi:hypothetical protein
MRRFARLYLIALCFSLFGVDTETGFAQQSEESEKAAESAPQPPEDNNTAEDRKLSSSDNRNNANFDLAVEVGFAPLPGVGLIAGGYLTSDDLIEASAQIGELNLLGLLLIKSELYELRYKRFWGNSFYTNIGPGLRTFRVSSPLVDALTKSESFEAEDSDIVLGLSVGNRWQWQHFLIGCDWIGVHLPLANVSSSVGEPTKSENSEEYKKRKSDWDSFGKSSTYQVLRFYLGIVF